LGKGHLPPIWRLMIIEQEPMIAKCRRFPTPPGGQVQRGLAGHVASISILDI